MGHREDARNRLKVLICKDHFERLATGNVCPACPSRVQNKAEVFTLAQAVRGGDERFHAAMLAELRGIREAQQAAQAELNNQGLALVEIRHAVHGDGTEGGRGLLDRVLIIETQSGSTGKWIGVMLGVVSAAIALAGTGLALAALVDK